VSRTVKDMRDGRRELRRLEVRERRRRRLAAADDQLIFEFLRERGRRRVQPSTENDRIEVVG
jgi:hypothetical protein